MPQSPPRIVVTGGAGFIGSHLVDRLLAKEAGDVVVLDNLTRGRLANLVKHRFNSHLQLIEGDVRDTVAVADVVRDARVVYHLAAQSTVLGAVRDATYTFHTNVIGTFNVLTAARLAGVERMLFASSREVYGEPITLPVDEDSPLLSINSYGASKVAGEAYCRAFRREFGLQVAILRLANVYGPRDIGRVIPTWIERATTGRDMQVYGGKQIVDFVWIDHVIDALISAASQDGPLPPTNIGSGTGTRIIDVARRISRLAVGHSRVQLQPARPMEVTRFIASVERMRQILGIEPPLDPLANLATMVPAPVGAERAGRPGEGAFRR
jgi:nucleoside-diphosphate-sugar epimerase